MTEKIHFIAACGTGMGTLACLLKEQGYQVSGSDMNVYPPMSNFLKKHQIPVFEGYLPEHLDHQPDLVIIGNAVTKTNPEAMAVMARGIPYMSMPQAVNHFIASDKKIILVTGTHGKTTTASIMGHILHTAGMDPSFMIGGILKDFQSSFRIGTGDYMVIEGDEYDTAFFDKGPKFMHYSPEIAIITGIEFDHADIYRDLEHITGAFEKFILKNRDNSHFITCSDNDNLVNLISRCDLPVHTYGKNGTWSFADYQCRKSLAEYQTTGPDFQCTIKTSMLGPHNMLNALACIAAAKKIGISDQHISAALASFSGVRRRQEIRGIKKGVTVMDDFAHHPTAVKETIRAVKPFYPAGRLIAVFEPRTNTSMRSFFQARYPAAFSEADMVCICRPSVKKDIPENEKFSTEKLVADLEKMGIASYHFTDAGQIIEFLTDILMSEDIVLIMSNGGFDNIHERLLEKIE